MSVKVNASSCTMDHQGSVHQCRITVTYIKLGNILWCAGNKACSASLRQTSGESLQEFSLNSVP